MASSRRRLLALGLGAGGALVGAGAVVAAPGEAERGPRVVPGATVWRDDFSGPAGAPPDAGSWTVRTGGRWGNGTELQAYADRPGDVALDGRGRLRIVVRREALTSSDGVPRQYTSARIDTAAKRQFRYGRLEARIRMPRGRGLLPAFWALPASFAATGRDTGEIDVVEVDGGRPDVALGSLHLPGRAGGQLHRTSHTTVAGGTDGAFHTYAVDWTPRAITFRVDGRAYATRTRAELERDGRWAFGEPYFLLLNVAVGNPATGAPDARTRLPATMLVDWVRVAHLRTR